MKKAALLITALTVAFTFVLSCNKNQKVVKELDGTWKVTSATTNGVTDSSFLGATYTFSKCKVKKEECDGSATQFGFTFPFKYSISEKGTKFKITQTIGTQTNVTEGTITEHSKDKFVFTSTEDNETTVITMTK